MFVHSPLLGCRTAVRMLVACALLAALAMPISVAFGQQAAPTAVPTGTTARIAVRVTSPPAANTVSGVLVALDRLGQAVPTLDSKALQVTLDGRQTELTLVQGRPSIALAAGFLLDSSASPQVRDTLANALAESLQAIDVNRDTVAVASTARSTPWEQANFTTSVDELKNVLNETIQSDPADPMVSLEQVSGLLRALSAQQRDTRALVLFTNRPLASAATAAATLGTLRTFATENGIQISIVALSGAGGQGVAESLAEATPNGRVEYALNATNRADIGRRLGLLLAPAFGARRFEVPVQGDGGHTLRISAPDAPLQATANFSVASPPVTIDGLLTANGLLRPGAELKQPTWVLAHTAESARIDSVEWSVDGRVTNVTTDPWALLLDPEQLGDGRHDLAARVVSQGRQGPLLTSDITVSPDFLRTVRGAVRAWGVIALLFVANAIVLVLFLRAGPGARTFGGSLTEFPPTLRLNQLAGKFVAPEVLEFPTKGKLRIGYHPPYMDNQVGSREFSKLPYQDVRGDDDAVKDLSRHVGCIWRDPRTNDCYIQLGWPGPGEQLRPKLQTQVFHLGRPQDATSEPFRLAHHDVVRMASGVEFVFYQVGLRDKATPESKKLSPFEDRSPGTAAISLLNGENRRQRAAQETTAEEG